MTCQKEKTMIQELIQHLANTEEKKKKEYSNSHDRYDNFHHMSKTTGKSVIEVIEVLQSKHFYSIDRLFNDSEFTSSLIKENKLKDYIFEKWGDYLIYEILKADYTYNDLLNKYNTYK